MSSPYLMLIEFKYYYLIRLTFDDEKRCFHFNGFQKFKVNQI